MKDPETRYDLRKWLTWAESLSVEEYEVLCDQIEAKLTGNELELFKSVRSLASLSLGWIHAERDSGKIRAGMELFSALKGLPE